MPRDLNDVVVSETTALPTIDRPAITGSPASVAGAERAAAQATAPAVSADSPSESARWRGHTDPSLLTGKGRIALDPRKETSRRENTYVTLRVAQNVRLVGNEVVTNWLDLVCFGAQAKIAERLVVGQQIYFWGTFGQVEYQPKNGGPTRLVNKVIVDYLDPGPRPASRE